MSKGGVGGWSHTGRFRRANPEPGGGERKKRQARLRLNIDSFWGVAVMQVMQLTANSASLAL